MLRFGDQLYQLTARDMTTSYLDPLFRALPTVSAGVGVVTAQAQLALPADRALFIHSVIISGLAEAATQWNSFTLGAIQQGVTVTTFYAKGISSAIGSAYTETISFELVLPPNVTSLAFSLNRSGTTGAVNANFTMVGYLIPPGKINRI